MLSSDVYKIEINPEQPEWGSNPKLNLLDILKSMEKEFPTLICFRNCFNL